MLVELLQGGGERFVDGTWSGSPGRGPGGLELSARVGISVNENARTPSPDRGVRCGQVPALDAVEFRRRSASPNSRPAT
jgi:hypothetical protein